MSFRRVLFGGAVVSFCALAASRAQAALDMFLEIPGVAGESTTAGCENRINILAWSFGGSKYEPGFLKVRERERRDVLTLDA